MPLVESAVAGPGPGSLPFSAIASSRKEKKKQAKEERDRLKQAEKKKRRLEKALATAAAIRTELEKKKQRRKEEEQRLDEEGAALAEAVALQVLDEDSDGLGQPQVAREGESQPGRGGEEGSLSSQERVGEEAGSVGSCKYSAGQSLINNDKSIMVSLTYLANVCFHDSNERGCKERETKEWKQSGWEASHEGMVGGARDDMGIEGELVEAEEGGTWEVYSSAEEKARTSNERARAAEMAAGLAAAQAVAALRIAEEARAEAEAAKKAAEVAMNEALDRCDTDQKPEFLDESKATTRCVEKERDDLKARLHEMERKLHEKTHRVSELEHNLEEVTQYLVEFKAMMEGCKHSPLALCDASKEKIAVSPKQGDATPPEPSCGTVDE